MSSNMLAGERRWASARKGGMTVLGKVAVPKPLNLPSQRLENHGLDPSVEIVPKGTLGWGSRPSSSGSNAWVSSSQLPNADGGNTSPIHLSGRPSSGGNVTRPSTAGSDRTHEPVASAWGSNSRPSSASGALASNHSSSTSLRPRSAETRPNSSQLSRFAEPVSESSVAWGPSSAAERLGVKSSKGDGFSLISGDFPTLGSEKDNITKNFESEEHTRPSSASGRVTPSKEDTRYHADSKSGVVNTWGPDGSKMEDDSFHPNMEKWPGEPPQYFNPNIPPQHFDAWRGPPANGPAGGWYRGQPRGSAFGAPGGFPMEPFPYYHPQVPPLGGPRGPHQKNGEFYHGPPHHGPPGPPHHCPPSPPHHGPPGPPYHGRPGPPHHGPPGPQHHGPPGPPHHGPPGPPHHGPPCPPHMPESYARPGMSFRPGFYRGPPGPPGSMAFEGYYGPPMGYHNNEREIPYMGMPAGPPVYNCYPGPNGPPDTDISHGRAGGRAISGKTMPEHMEADHLKNHKELDRKVEGEDWEHSVQSRRNNEWGADDDDDDDDAKIERSAMKRTTSENSSRNLSYRDRYSDSVDLKSFGGMHNVNKSGNMATFPPQMPQLPVATKDPDLMQKIEGLNAKIRATDGRKDARNVYSNNTGEVVHVPSEVIDQAGENQTLPTVVDPRSSHHGGQGRVEHHGKGKFNNQDNDGWRRKPLTPEFFGAAKASNMESAHGPSFVGEAAEKLLVSTVAKVEGGESVAEAYDSTDIQAQRAKMRELAKQRALQLQKEEEERIREQKAKALAKLEELNRRTQTGEAVTEEAEKFTGDVQREEQESCAAGDINVVDRESVKSKSGKPDEVSENLRPDAPQTAAFESNASRGLTSPIKENNCGDDRKAAVRSNDVGPSMHKRTGYKQKQQKSFIEKSFPISASEVHKSDTGILDADIKSMEAPSNEQGPNIESDVQDSPKTGLSTTTTTITQRKKVNKSGKNKHKVDDTRTVPALPPVTSDTNPEKKPIEPEGTKASEESENKSTNNWKPQPVHRMQRSHQAKRFTDKAHGSEAIWAPVRTTHNKAEDTVEKATVESTDFINSDNVSHNNSLKGKRAEMERYVPKPVAKELAQQGSVPLSSSSISSSRSDEVPMVQFGSISFESPQNVSCTNASVGSVSLDVKEGDGRHSKHKKEHGHWRQRGTGHSPIKGTQHQTEQTQLVTSDIIYSGNSEINASVEDHQVATGRGKRRVPGKRTSRMEMDGNSVQLAAPDVDYNERNVDVREHRGTGERTSHWKPKSHANLTNYQHINKPGGNETVITTEIINKLPKKVHSSQRKVQVHNKESSNTDNSLHDINVAEESMPGNHQAFNREKKPFPAKGHSTFPNQDSVLYGESAPTGNTSGFRKHAGQSNRYARGHEFHGDWPSGQDNRPHNVQRQRNYEYQPVGPTKGGNLDMRDELTDGANNNGSQRFEERGQSHSKRGGNYYRRQGGAARVES